MDAAFPFLPFLSTNFELKRIILAVCVSSMLPVGLVLVDLPSTAVLKAFFGHSAILIWPRLIVHDWFSLAAWLSTKSNFCDSGLSPSVLCEAPPLLKTGSLIFADLCGPVGGWIGFVGTPYS